MISNCMYADIDECVSLDETCLDENAHCVNSVGNFSCQCVQDSLEMDTTAQVSYTL